MSEEKRDMQGTKLVPHPRTGKLVHPYVVERYNARQKQKEQEINLRGY